MQNENCLYICIVELRLQKNILKIRFQIRPQPMMKAVFQFMEVWRKIEGFESYEVSNLGRVKNSRGMILKTYESNGYLKLNISKDAKKVKFRIHQLVAMVFLNHKPCGYEKVVNHINLNKKDNRVENLEIISQRENCNLKHKKSSSQFVGVSWHKRDKKWQGKIQIKDKQVFLGYFNSENEANLAYQKALKTINN